MVGPRDLLALGCGFLAAIRAAFWGASFHWLLFPVGLICGFAAVFLAVEAAGLSVGAAVDHLGGRYPHYRKALQFVLIAAAAVVLLAACSSLVILRLIRDT